MFKLKTFVCAINSYPMKMCDNKTLEANSSCIKLLNLMQTLRKVKTWSAGSLTEMQVFSFYYKNTSVYWETLHGDTTYSQQTWPNKKLNKQENSIITCNIYYLNFSVNNENETAWTIFYCNERPLFYVHP